MPHTRATIILIIIIKPIIRIKIKYPGSIRQRSCLIGHPKIIAIHSPTVSDQPCAIRRRFICSCKIIFGKIVIPADNHHRMATAAISSITVSVTCQRIIPSHCSIIVIIHNTCCTMLHDLLLYIILIFSDINQIRIFQMWHSCFIGITCIQSILQYILRITIRDIELCIRCDPLTKSAGCHFIIATII